MSTKKQSFFLSLFSAIVFTLVAHIRISFAYAEAWKAPLNFTPRKPVVLVVYFFLVLIAFYIVKVYRTRGFVIVMSIFFLALLVLTLRNKDIFGISRIHKYKRRNPNDGLFYVWRLRA